MAMFVIELVYKAALADIDAHMPAHVKFQFRASQRADDIQKRIDGEAQNRSKRR